ncbi:hypothetical protein DQ04_14041000 [Trypanosoma grayi]|uniref:hypothetical protein n=1 Tax=Trypanosoma grayi TaxID=71804 RepID=UPI0004F4413B|nr:hypothetical protein DQ04_14041000 [Trypanosoma grayi]KEG06414.1 hypothetical protein DQ04_14041000 [Trypanosoma grayi]
MSATAAGTQSAATTTPHVAHIQLLTRRVQHDDACLNWIKSRYTTAGAVAVKHNMEEETDVFLVQLENDLAACATHRWAPYSYHSPVYDAASPQYASGRSNSTEACIENLPAEGAATAFNVTLRNAPSMAAEPSPDDVMQSEPSRHIFTQAVRKREQKRIAEIIETDAGTGGSSASRRPFFGGYFSSPLAGGATRFLLFPQWMHDTAAGDKRPQELLYFLRGTISRRSVRPRNSDGAPQEDSGLMRQLLQEIILNVSLSRKFKTEAPRWKLFNCVDAIRTDLYANNESTERYFSPSNETDATTGIANDKDGELTAVKFRDAGARTSFSYRDPRKSFTLNSAFRVTRNFSYSKEAQERAVASFAVMDEYDSAVQRFTSPMVHRRFPDARYHLQWAAGPGVEYATGTVPWTVFGKLVTEWWAEFPLTRRLSFRLRNQSALVQPLCWQHLAAAPQRAAISGDIDDGAASEGATVTSSGTSSCAATHELFWATQGPRWDSRLVRGFEDDYKSMHYASHWYTLFSAELLSHKQRGNDRTPSKWRPPRGMLYLNACFIDSFTRPPRASVGFSFTGAPRLTSDAFNVITPSSFECSFNWWLNFQKERVSLESGLSAGRRAEDSILRLSPVETFRHLRCGLTWNL